MNKINDNQTILEVARVLQPKLKRAAVAFEQELKMGICRYLVDHGMYEEMDRLEGHITIDQLHCIRNMVTIARQEYENLLLKGLLGFVLHHEPLVIPEVQMEAFYEVIYKMISRPSPDLSLEGRGEECPEDDMPQNLNS